MPSNIVIPSVGESITSGVIGRWNKKDGDTVNRDDIVLELETDKVTMEVRAESGGVLRHRAKQGETVAVGAVVGVVEDGGAGAVPAAAAASAPAAAAAPAAAPAATKPASAPAPVAASAAHTTDVRATPLAKRTAEDMGVDLSKVAATGIGHRVREKDVIDFLQSKAPGVSATGTTPVAGSSPAAAATTAVGVRSISREPMSQLRKRIATRLVEAQHTAAMLTTFNEVDMSAVMALRTQYKEEFEKKHGIGLGFMSFFVKASVHALKAFPLINSYIVEGQSGPEIEKHDYMDIALAVSTPKGLLVPVLRNCQSLSMAKIESSIKDFAVRGKDGKIGVDELQGGTFTITNGGVFGSLMSTPILNPPQSAILGMHAIKNRAVEDPKNPGQVAIRPMMYLALSYDHRIVDGAEAVQFLVTIKKCIEDPTRLLMDI
jgi:2-oxoglutarate dehydrogenase E2 component (dihydrolipoamide succinyltransferase)